MLKHLGITCILKVINTFHRVFNNKKRALKRNGGKSASKPTKIGGLLLVSFQFVYPVKEKEVFKSRTC